MADKTPPKPPQEKRGGWLSRFAPGVRKIVSRRETPDNLWVKDPYSGEMLYRSDLEAALWVTPSGRHMRINATQRLGYTFDDGEYEAISSPDVVEDPLKFSDGTPYRERLIAARKATGSKDAMSIGFGDIGGTPAVAVVADWSGCSIVASAGIREWRQQYGHCLEGLPAGFRGYGRFRSILSRRNQRRRCVGGGCRQHQEFWSDRRRSLRRR